jgi:hypothetical protein
MLLTPGQGNGAFNSSGMIAAWEMENGQWVLKSRPIGDLEVEAAIKKAYLAYQSAADDAARSKAAADLKANLEKQYDKFVEGQSKQIEEMEKRLAKLKEQLDKRRAAKERVVDLKLQMVLSQAEGLGFPESGLPNSATNYGDDQGRNPNAYRALVPPASLLPPQGLPFQSIPPAANPTPQVPMGDGEGQNQIE